MSLSSRRTELLRSRPQSASAARSAPSGRITVGIAEQLERQALRRADRLLRGPRIGAPVVLLDNVGRRLLPRRLEVDVPRDRRQRRPPGRSAAASRGRSRRPRLQSRRSASTAATGASSASRRRLPVRRLRRRPGSGGRPRRYPTAGHAAARALPHSTARRTRARSSSPRNAPESADSPSSSSRSSRPSASRSA